VLEENSKTQPQKAQLELEKLETQPQKAQLELEKLDREVAKLRRDTSAWGFIATVLAPLGTLVAICTLSWTIFSNLRTQRDGRFRSAVTSVVRGETTAERLDGVSQLAPFWHDDGSLLSTEGGYRRELRVLALTQIISNPDDRVRDALHQALIASGVDSMLLTQLAQQNRSLQEGVTALGVPPGGTAPTLPPDSSYESIIAQDAAFQRATHDLRWNIRTLRAALDAMGTITDVDLSYVTLSQPIVRETSGGAHMRLVDGGVLRRALRFQGVDFTGANLTGLHFRDARFESVKLDSAILAGTQFNAAFFDSATSMRAIKTLVLGFSVGPGQRFVVTTAFEEPVVFAASEIAAPNFSLSSPGCGVLQASRVPHVPRADTTISAGGAACGSKAQPR
jgi:hypothetical protein